MSTLAGVRPDVHRWPRRGCVPLPVPAVATAPADLDATGRCLATVWVCLWMG